MSIAVMSLVFPLVVSATLKLVLLALADFADDSGGNIFPSIQTLAWKASMSVRSVQRHLRDLEARGWLVQVEPARHDRPARYRLRVDVLRELRGDAVAPGDSYGGAGATTAPGGVTSTTSRGVTVSPNPSVEPPEKHPSQEPPEARAHALAWLQLLNEEADCSFRQTDANLRPIRARLHEGFTVEDAKAVVVAKVREWRGTDRAQYLRPATVFGPKFDGYLQATRGTSASARVNGRPSTRAIYTPRTASANGTPTAPVSVSDTSIPEPRAEVAL